MSDQLPTIPGFEVESLLGVGGMARVYLAIQSGFERAVALKIMSPALAQNEEFGRRFLREARIVGMLSHAHIVPVYEVGEHESQYYLAMEILNEGDLRQRIINGMSEHEVLTMIEQIARALRYAHDKGFIHRDVKPDNILYRDAETAVLTDFGIARLAEQSDEMTEITQVASVIGSPKYMSPEQAIGQKLDLRTDIYSLGVILYQALTGTVPFTGRSLTEISLQRVQNKQPELPAEFSHLQTLADGMLAYDRKDRFADCSKLLDELALVRQLDSFNTFTDELTPTATIQDEPTALFTETGASPSGVKPTSSGHDGRKALWTTAGISALAILALLTWTIVTEPDEPNTTTTTAPTEPVLEESTTPPKAIAVTPAEFFAYQDAVRAGYPALADAFLTQHPQSIFADIVAIKSNDNPERVSELTLSAQNGDHLAQFILSELYDTGWGVPVDTDYAIQQARAAAESKAPLALFQLSALLLNNAPEDDERREGLSALQQAASGGLFLAQTKLASHYFVGDLIAKDVDAAVELLEAAATQGDRNALFNLGQLYELDYGEPSAGEAQALFQEAARLGHPQALAYVKRP